MKKAIGITAVVAVVVAGVVLLNSGKPPADVQSAMTDPSIVTQEPANEVADTAPIAPDGGGAPASFKLSDDTDIAFTGYKIGGSQTFNFFEFEGGVSLADGRPESATIRVAVDLHSLVHESSSFADIMKGPDFFDVANHPEATFESTGVRKESDAYRVDGDLTLRGITKPISFLARIDLADDRLHLTTRFKVNRQAWEITYKGRGDALIRDEVLMDITLVADRVRESEQR